MNWNCISNLKRNIDVIPVVITVKFNGCVIPNGWNCTWFHFHWWVIVIRVWDWDGLRAKLGAQFNYFHISHSHLICDILWFILNAWEKRFDISTIGLEDLRSRMSIIPQDPGLVCCWWCCWLVIMIDIHNQCLPTNHFAWLIVLFSGTVRWVNYSRN